MGTPCHLVEDTIINKMYEVNEENKTCPTRSTISCTIRLNNILIKTPILFGFIFIEIKYLANKKCFFFKLLVLINSILHF